MTYAREDIPNKHIFHNERSICWPWVLFGTYHKLSHADIYHFDNLNKAFDT